MELPNRFPRAVTERLGRLLSEDFKEGLRELDNVRPLFCIPGWIEGVVPPDVPQLRHLAAGPREGGAGGRLNNCQSYKVMTLLAFFADGERGGCRLEAWTGALG